MFYKILISILCFFFKIIYNPKIINNNLIPKDKAVILAGNHTNYFDCLMLFSSTKRQIHFLAKKELFDGPLKIIYKALGVIPIDRKTKDFLAKEKVIDTLNKGKVVAIFPEGTINKTNDIVMPFKYGAVSFSNKTNALIIPFAIKGDYKFRSKNLKIEFSCPLEKNIDLQKYNENLTEEVKYLLTKD